jgi:hypothetical protein
MTKVRHTAKAAENVPYVIRRLHSLLKGAIPRPEYPANHFNPNLEKIVNSDLKAVLVKDCEMLVRAHVGRRSIKVGPWWPALVSYGGHKGPRGR